MFNPTVDLGQVILASLIGTIGFFVKRTIDDFGRRLDRHEEIIFKVVKDTQLILGLIDRRKSPRYEDDE